VWQYWALLVDWRGGLAALFADRVRFDMSAAGRDPATGITRDELASLARTVLSGFTATQHRASNVLTTVDGDIAHCRAMVDAWHTVPADPCLVTQPISGRCRRARRRAGRARRAA
jgi:hypothetical protein